MQSPSCAFLLALMLIFYFPVAFAKRSPVILLVKNMANTLSPLSKNQADDLFSEINSLFEDDIQDESQPKIGIKNHNVLPTMETFDKAEVLQCLKILEPNSVIFFQDLSVRIRIVH